MNPIPVIPDQPAIPGHVRVKMEAVLPPGEEILWYGRPGTHTWIRVRDLLPVILLTAVIVFATFMDMWMGPFYRPPSYIQIGLGIAGLAWVLVRVYRTRRVHLPAQLHKQHYAITRHHLVLYEEGKRTAFARKIAPLHTFRVRHAVQDRGTLVFTADVMRYRFSTSPEDITDENPLPHLYQIRQPYAVLALLQGLQTHA